MKSFTGKMLSWECADGVVELTLHRKPYNEIGLETLQELEKFADVARIWPQRYCRTDCL